ncbi:MAG: aminopeptidase P family protein, partial [Sphingobacteriales bacterium]
MTLGIGGSTASVELDKIQNRTHGLQPIALQEYEARLKRATDFMAQHSVNALYINAGTNLYYFTGTLWNASERMVGALLFDDGTLQYIAPKFEEGTFKKYRKVEADINCWEEHESPYALISQLLRNKNLNEGVFAIDESAPYFLVDGISVTEVEEFINKAHIKAGVTSGSYFCIVLFADDTQYPH